MVRVSDGERILDERLTVMMNQPHPEGFPRVGPDVAVEEHLQEMEAEMSEYMSMGWEDALSDDRGY